MLRHILEYLALLFLTPLVSEDDCLAACAVHSSTTLPAFFEANRHRLELQKILESVEKRLEMEEDVSHAMDSSGDFLINFTTIYQTTDYQV